MYNSLTLLQILRIFLLLMSCGALVIMILHIPNFMFEGKFNKRIILYAILFLVSTPGAFLTEDKIYSELKTKAETEYVVYLDGQEVNPDTIAFKQYSYSLNDEEKTIMLTKKRNRSRIYIPISIFR